MKKPLPRDVAEEVSSGPDRGRLCISRSSFLALTYEAGLGTFLHPSGMPAWESCRGCQGFTGPAPSTLLDEQTA